MKRNDGQITVEDVLILTIFVSIMFSVSQLLKEKKILASVVEGPWLYIAGMIENGYWAPPEMGQAKHPNHMQRHGSPQGDTP